MPYALDLTLCNEVVHLTGPEKTVLFSLRYWVGMGLTRSAFRSDHRYSVYRSIIAMDLFVSIHNYEI